MGSFLADDRRLRPSLPLLSIISCSFCIARLRNSASSLERSEYRCPENMQTAFSPCSHTHGILHCSHTHGILHCSHTHGILHTPANSQKGPYPHMLTKSMRSLGQLPSTHTHSLTFICFTIWSRTEAFPATPTDMDSLSLLTFLSSATGSG